MRLYRARSPTVNDEVNVEDLAKCLGWPVELPGGGPELDERGLIETDWGSGRRSLGSKACGNLRGDPLALTTPKGGG